MAFFPQHNANDTASAKIPELQAQDIVTISFTGRLASTSSSSSSSALTSASSASVSSEPPSSPPCRGEEIGPIFQVASRWTIVIGDRDVVNAVEMGVRFMTHQTARVYSHAKFALGPGTRTWGSSDGSGGGECTVPPNANVLYDITIDDIVTTVDDRTLLEVARTRKMIGNDIFRHEHVAQHEFAKQRALHQYKKAIAVLESLLQSKTATEADPGTDAFRAEVWQCLLDCRNNIAAVHLSCQDYHAAKLACIETLQLDPANGTALVRAAKACLYDPSSSFVEASAALRSAQDVLRDDDTDVALLQSLRRQLHQRWTVHKAREREMANKMARGVTTAPVPRNDASTLALPSAGGRNKRQKKMDRQRHWSISLLLSSWMFIVVPVVGILLAVFVPLLIARYHSKDNRQ